MRVAVRLMAESCLGCRFVIGVHAAHDVLVDYQDLKLWRQQLEI